jgi:hypothetical protein
VEIRVKTDGKIVPTRDFSIYFGKKSLFGAGKCPELRSYALKRRAYSLKRHTYQLSLGAFNGFIIFMRILYQ